MNFLIVDPEANRQRTLRSILSNLGYKAGDVESVLDAEAMLHSIKRKRYHCVFAASELPRREGLDFITEIKTVKKDMPVIIYSSKPSREEVTEAIEIGAAGYFVTPCSVADVEDAIKRAIGKKAFA